MNGVPAPLILAPRLFKKSAKKTISGSQAALLKSVFPLAKTAVRIIVSVAVTLIKGKTNLVPFNFLTVKYDPFFSSFILTPKALNPSKNISRGRCPITHPPD